MKEEFEVGYALQQAFKETSELVQRNNGDFDRYIAAQSDDEKFKELYDKRGKKNDELIQSLENSKKQLEEIKAGYEELKQRGIDTKKRFKGYGERVGGDT